MRVWEEEEVRGGHIYSSSIYDTTLHSASLRVDVILVMCVFLKGGRRKGYSFGEKYDFHRTMLLYLIFRHPVSYAGFIKASNGEERKRCSSVQKLV